ncbi:hypothetical protein pb186bvf_017374 [Paramecium bursaria]
MIDQKIKAFFTCQKCFQFCSNPQECRSCKLLTCFECIKTKSNFFCLKFNFRGCSCFADVPENLNQMTRYIYDSLQSKCENCEEDFYINRMKIHYNKCLRQEQQAYLYFENQERLNHIISDQNRNLTISKCKICLKFPFEPVQDKFSNYYCKHCVQINYRNYSHLDENSIISFNSLVMQCKVCQIIGSFFEMQNHKMICSLEKVSCKCSWIGYKSYYKDHLIQCISREIDEGSNLLNQKIITQKLVMLDCYISKINYVKQGSKCKKVVNEFDLQENYPDYDLSSQANSQSDQLYNIYDIQYNFDSN